MKTNVKTAPIHTHEGARAKHINPLQQLRRSVMSCMLWEDEFYEDGVQIAQRIAESVMRVAPEDASAIAVEAREKMKLRHVPLWIVRAMAKANISLDKRHTISETLARVIQRPDELMEFMSIYWAGKKGPVSAQIKKGLAAAFKKFNEYQFAKWDSDGKIKLRDVLFLCHAKPEGDEQTALFKKITDNKLATPDTWEVALSGGADKKATFTRLLAERKLGALALLRNLRNMQQADVALEDIRAGLENMKVERVLPFRFISAAKHAPRLEPDLEKAMFKCTATLERMPGTTVLAIDTSASMSAKVSGKSEISRRDAAAALAMLLREVCEECRVVAFGSTAGEVPPRRGFGLNEAIGCGRYGHGTDIGAACRLALEMKPDRIIVITDEQSATPVGDPPSGAKGYFINVASARNGVGYGAWTHIDGWSEAVIDYIQELEATKTSQQLTQTETKGNS